MNTIVHKNVLWLLLLALMLGACNATKKIVYARGAGHYPALIDSTAAPIPQGKFKIGDLLTITVYTTTPEISIPFNLPLIPAPTSINGANFAGSTAVALQTYLIDPQGEITFPVVGKIKAEGLTEMELSRSIRDKLYPRYIKEDPIITIRYANYKISVLGEVNRPGLFPLTNEKVNIFEALALAGDMTIYGKRNNVLLIREESDGSRKSYRLNLNDKELIHSPYFFLQQNDVLYVQPNGPRSRSADFGTGETLTVSIIGTVISLAALLVTVFKK